MKPFYLQARGSSSACYDRTGITFPETIPVDWEALFAGLDVQSVEWRNQFDWANQPEVICFTATDEARDELDDRIEQNRQLDRAVMTVLHWSLTHD